MLTPDTFQGDEWLRRHLSWLVSSPFTKIGKLESWQTTQELADALVKAKYEKVRYLPNAKLSIYRTTDLGYGYVNAMALQRFRELSALLKLEVSTRVYLQHFHGNIQACVKLSDIGLDCLKTDEVYVFYQEEEKKVWGVQLGKPSNPNRLYTHKGLEGKSGTIAQVSLIPGLNRINVIDTSIITDLP